MTTPTTTTTVVRVDVYRYDYSPAEWDSYTVKTLQDGEWVPSNLLGSYPDAAETVLDSLGYTVVASWLETHTDEYSTYTVTWGSYYYVCTR